MNALMKWLAKHADTLTESQKVAAKGAHEAGNEVSKLADTAYFLEKASPKEQADIRWLYRPSQNQAGKQYSTAAKELRGSFGLAPEIGHRDPVLKELLDDLDTESWNGPSGGYASVSDMPHDPAFNHKFRYRNRED